METKGAMAVDADGTLASRDLDFEKHKQEMPKTFESNKKYYHPFVFAGITINKDNNGYFLEQTEYSKLIKN